MSRTPNITSDYRIINSKGKIVEKYRLKATAIANLLRLKEIHGKDLEIIRKSNTFPPLK